MSSWYRRVLLLASLAGLVAALVGATPAAADPAPLPPPTVTPTSVVVGTTTVVAGAGCFDSNGHGDAASTWLADGTGQAVGFIRYETSGSDGTWSARLTVPLEATPYQTLYVHSVCGDPEFGSTQLYPLREVVPQPTAATPWHAQQPQLPVVPNGRLQNTSCVTAAACVAVGTYRRAAVDTPLAEVFDGSNWRLSPLPDVPDSRGASLTGVSCATATSCTAVGRVTTSHGVRPLTASYSRGGWQLSVLPVDSDNENVTEADLAGVSCPAASQCVAVGRAGDLSDALPFWSPTAYVLDGGTWTVNSPPVPAQQYYTGLDSVSCQSVTSCVAVGTPDFGAGNVVQVYDGSTWAAGPTPADPQVKMTSVSCPAHGLCVAVGFVTDGRVDTVSQPWAGQLELTGWSNLALGDVGTGSLETVACATATSCVGIGRRGTRYAPGAPWSARRVGNTWSAADVADGSLLTGVSCLRASGCTAVGGHDGVPVAERGNGITWSVSAVPAPAGLPDATFDAVTCAADSACTVVGRYVDALGVGRPLTDRWDGSGWSLQALPDVPSGQLSGVSCPTASACTAVGRVQGAGRTPHTLIMQWDSAAGWRVATGPASTDGVLAAVSCGSAVTCLAGGSDPNGQPLVLALRSGRWIRVASPPHGNLTRVTMPTVSCVGASCRTVVSGSVGDFTPGSIGLRWSGAQWTADPQRSDTIVAVSCVTATRCVETLLGGVAPSVVRIQNTDQTAEELPIDGAEHAPLPGLSCRDQLRCVAVGQGGRGASITRWNGRVWQLEPVAASVPYVAALSGVACVSGAGRCVAVGGGGSGPPTILVDTPAN